MRGVLCKTKRLRSCATHHVQIMGDISGMPCQRIGAHLDVYVGQPPCVVAKEKDNPSKLGDAIRACLTNTVWIPHYALLPFMVGVAIAAGLVEFFTFNAQGMKTGVQYNLPRIEDRAK